MILRQTIRIWWLFWCWLNLSSKFHQNVTRIPKIIYEKIATEIVVQDIFIIIYYQGIVVTMKDEKSCFSWNWLYEEFVLHSILFHLFSDLSNYQLWHNFCLRRHLETFDLTHRLQILSSFLNKYKTCVLCGTISKPYCMILCTPGKLFWLYILEIVQGKKDLFRLEFIFLCQLLSQFMFNTSGVS